MHCTRRAACASFCSDSPCGNVQLALVLSRLCQYEIEYANHCEKRRKHTRHARIVLSLSGFPWVDSHIVVLRISLLRCAGNVVAATIQSETQQHRFSDLIAVASGVQPDLDVPTSRNTLLLRFCQRGPSLSWQFIRKIAKESCSVFRTVRAGSGGRRRARGCRLARAAAGEHSRRPASRRCHHL